MTLRFNFKGYKWKKVLNHFVLFFINMTPGKVYRNAIII